MLSPHQVFEIIERQAEDPRPFGTIAVAMGHLTESDVECLLRIQAVETLSVSGALVEAGTITADDLDLARQEAASGPMAIKEPA